MKRCIENNFSSAKIIIIHDNFLTRREALKILGEIRIIFRIKHVTVGSYFELQG